MLLERSLLYAVSERSLLYAVSVRSLLYAVSVLRPIDTLAVFRGRVIMHSAQNTHLRSSLYAEVMRRPNLSPKPIRAQASCS
jgi:hypothetical protein